MPTRNRVPMGRWFKLLLLGLSTSLAAQVVQQGPTTVRQEVHHDVSPPLRDLIRNAPPPSLQRREAEPVRRIPLPPGLSQLSEDPIRQRTIAPITPLVAQSFEGLGYGQYGFTINWAPPDTNGAVGATQYVQWVNTSFAIFNKSTGALVGGPTAGNTLWSGFGGGCQNNNDGDPIAIYDKLANRWVMSQFSVSTHAVSAVHRGLHHLRCPRHLVPLLLPVHGFRRLSEDGGLAGCLLRNLQHVPKRSAVHRFRRLRL